MHYFYALYPAPGNESNYNFSTQGAPSSPYILTDYTDVTGYGFSVRCVEE